MSTKITFYLLNIETKMKIWDRVRPLHQSWGVTKTLEILIDNNSMNLEHTKFTPFDTKQGLKPLNATTALVDD